MINGIIYMYTSPSGKKYIGQTINEYSRRATFMNPNHIYSGLKIENARKKYLPQNFIYEVLEKVEYLDKLELLAKLNELESKYITQYNSYKNGYNSSLGGNNFFIYNDEIKDKIAKAKSHRILQYDLDGYFLKEWDSIKDIILEFNCCKSTISRCCSGISKKSLGYIWKYKTDEVKLVLDIQLSESEKISSKSYANRTVVDGITYKSVLQYSVNGNFLKEYTSIKDAVKCNEKTNRTSLSGCCTGKFKTSGGFIWRYKLSEEIPITIDTSNITAQDIIRSSLNKNGEKPILQYDLSNNLINSFKSISSACAELNIQRTGIYQCCTGKLLTYKKCIWKYDI